MLQQGVQTFSTRHSSRPIEFSAHDVHEENLHKGYIAPKRNGHVQSEMLRDRGGLKRSWLHACKRRWTVTNRGIANTQHRAPLSVTMGLLASSSLASC